MRARRLSIRCTRRLRLERSSNIQAQTTGSMEFLASATGGRAYYNTNNIALGIHSAIEDSSSYYMLGYYVDQQRVKSGWQTIAVKVRQKGEVFVHETEYSLSGIPVMTRPKGIQNCALRFSRQ